MDPAQARAEAVVAHDHHAGPSFCGKLAKAPDRFIEPADDLGGGVVPVGPVDARFHRRSRYGQTRCWNGSRFWN